MWRLSLTLEVGRTDDEDPVDSQLDAMVDMGPDPRGHPLGFAPASDPTRRSGLEEGARNRGRLR